MSHERAIYVAVGSNLPGKTGTSPIANCKAAVEAFRSLYGLSVVGVSRWYETESIPPGGPDYVNGVVYLIGDCDPVDLLHRLQAIEARAGRTRPAPNAPRMLDLDIIAIGEMGRTGSDPILPHPRAHLRRFVLQPLRDVAPGWRHPILGQTIDDLLLTVSGQAIAPL